MVELDTVTVAEVAAWTDAEEKTAAETKEPTAAKMEELTAAETTQSAVEAVMSIFVFALQWISYTY